ncbi:hypothetical protein [Photorhabdus temperata]|uniref:hypothetical protein n=1 Tax=Photorhabdus temperata TaxID=574560 RepID=UPI001FB19017|nr:hypothetical protein [Photorhabdus temperata]
MVITSSDLLCMVRQGAKVLSALSGALEIELANRSLICLIELPQQQGQCVLAVSASHRLDPHVLAYEETVKRQRFHLSDSHLWDGEHIGVVPS